MVKSIKWELLKSNFGIMIKKDWKIYYTLVESKKISDENIIKSAQLLIQDLRKSEQILVRKKEIYV